MSQKSISDLNLNSITISNSNYSNVSGYVEQANTLQTNNAGELLVNGVPISSGGGGGDTFDQVYIGVSPNPVVELTCAVDDVLVAGGETVATRPYVATNYLTIADANNDYLKITDAQTEYQTQADMAVFSTTAEANALYQPIGNYLSTINVSNLKVLTFNSTNSDTLPVTIASNGTYNHTTPVYDLPYNANNILFFTIQASSTTVGAIFDRYAITQVQSGVPDAGTNLQIVLSNPFANSITINGYFVLVVTTN